MHACKGIIQKHNPNLQPLSREQFNNRSASVEDGARLDVSAESFWGWDRRLAYFDVKVFNPFASSYASSPLVIRKGNMMKEFVRLKVIFSSSGGMGPLAIVVFKCKATLLSEKRGHPYLLDKNKAVLLSTSLCSNVSTGI